LKNIAFRVTKRLVTGTPLSPIARQVFHRYQYLVDERHPIQDTEKSDDDSLVQLGTEYGGWTFVDEPKLHGSTIISAGLGEDASFDVEFARRYDATVVVVDPTPRAVRHFEELSENIGTEKEEPYAHSGKEPIEAYDLTGIDESQLILVEKALWSEETDIEFYEPEVKSHVSHSIVDWQNDYRQSTDYIKVPADTLTSVIDSQKISRDEVQLVKFDIEGAEVEVIENMVEDGFLPAQILVEFDELHNPSEVTFDRVERTHELLLDSGYELLYSDGNADFLYYNEVDC
jgi:FkbM family methyltransferase